MIKFSCPNGHVLTTMEDRAGTAAKCPKCNAPVVVPMSTESASNITGASLSGSGRLTGSNGVGSTPSIGTGSTPQLPSPDLIIFLCPNGHKLNGPAKLKGKAGQCPHCGAKFRIPDDDDEEDLVDEFEEIDEEHVARSLSDEEFAAAGSNKAHDITEFRHHEPELEPFEEAPPSIVDAFLSTPPAGVHPYASILAQLWESKEPGQTIELHLEKGEVFTPELFAESLSHAQFGVFGRREKEGGYSLIMLPWENISRIEIRRVKQVPVGVLK